MKSASLISIAMLFSLLAHAGEARFERGPQPGTSAPDFQLKALDGTLVRASALWSNKPTLIMTGSYTCPVFRRKVDDFHSLMRDYGHQVHFLILYTVEAHPKGDPSPYTGKEWVTPANEKIGLLLPQTKTFEQRLDRAKTCAKALNLKSTVVIDDTDDRVWEAYGNAPNTACLVGRDGKVIEREGWFDAAKMRKALQQTFKD